MAKGNANHDQAVVGPGYTVHPPGSPQYDDFFDDIKPIYTLPDEMYDGENKQEAVKGSQGVTGSLEQEEAAYRLAVAVIDAKREALASEFQPLFNAYARALPTATYEEKKAAKDILNAELRSRGFGVKCPKTGLPSFLQVRPGDYPERGRFQFAHAENGKTVTTVSSNDLPVFEVILEKVSRTSQKERGGTWTERKGSRSNQGQGGRK